TTLCKKGGYQDALPPARRALALAEANLPPTHPDLAPYLLIVGKALIGVGASREALPLLERALKLKGTSEDLTEVKFDLARALVTAHEGTARALALARQAREEWRKSPEHADDVADVDRWLGQHS